MMIVEVCSCAHTFLPNSFGTNDIQPHDGISDTSAFLSYAGLPLPIWIMIMSSLAWSAG